MTPKFLTLAAALLTLAACGDTPSSVDAGALQRQQLAGSYHVPREFGSTEFLVIENGDTTRLHEIGASLSIQLSPDGTSTGRLFVPGADEDGGDLDASMAGKWSAAGNTLRFEQDADTFVRDMPFTIHGNRLEGDATFSGTRIRVVLRKW